MAVIVVMRKLPAAAMAIFPFILVKHASYKSNIMLMNHERIHFKQQLEMLILPFFVLYLFNYLFNIFKYRSHYQAYLNIVFEREAYAHENDLNYLRKRKLFAWINWLKV